MSIHEPSRQFVAGIPVTIRPRAFETAVNRYAMPEGMTLAEIAAHVPDLPAAFWDCGVIKVGGAIIDPGIWHIARPRVGRDGGELVVELYLMPGKGGGFLEIFASIALLGLTFGAGLINPALGAVVGIAGKILLGLLFKPHQPDTPKKPRDPVSYGVSANPAKPLEQLERVLGRMQASPPYLSNPYSTLVDQDVYVEAVVGFCGNHEVTDVQFNGTDIDDNETVTEYQTREGDPSDTAITIATFDAFEEKPGLALSNFDLDTRDGHLQEIKDQDFPEKCDPQWHSFAMHGAGDEAKARFLFPQGLLKKHDDSEDIDRAGIPIRTQFRRRGDADWINGPELHYVGKDHISQELRQEFRLLWQADATVSTVNGDFYARSAYWAAARGQSFEWIADPYFDPGDGDILAQHVVQTDNGFDIYLDPMAFARGEYEVRVKRGLNYNREFFNASSYRYGGSAGDANFFGYVFAGGKYKVTVPENNFTTAAQVETFTTLSYDYPLPAPADMPLTLIAVKVKNGNINAISATFHSRVNTWNGADWNTYEPSSNPAALYRHVLKDDLNAKPLDPSIIDDAGLQDWHDDNVSTGRECNCIVADSVENVLKLVATAGWAIPRQNEKWGVIVEHDRSAESIVQNFTPLNSKGFSAEKSFDDIPHAIYAEFVSEIQDYTVKNRTIYGDGYGPSNATLFQTIKYDSITSPDQIDLRALMDWRQMRYRQTRRTIEISAESLLSERGDLVGLTHDVVGQKFFYGLVDGVLTSGGNVTGLRLEAVAELSQAAGACGVWVRYEDGTSIEAPITETIDTNTITFVTPFAIPADGILAPGCLVGLGLVSHIYKRMLVFDVRPAKNWGARLTLIDEAPEVFAGSGLSLDFSQAKNSQYLL